MILETLENVTNKLNSSVGGIKNAVSEVDHKVRKGDTRFSGLANEIVTSIQNLQDGIIYEMKGRRENVQRKINALTVYRWRIELCVRLYQICTCAQGTK